MGRRRKVKERKTRLRRTVRNRRLKRKNIHKRVGKGEEKRAKTSRKFLYLKTSHPKKAKTNFDWCALKSKPQMKIGCSVQNEQCRHTGTVEGKVPDICSQIAEPMFLKKWDRLVQITPNDFVNLSH
jgi:hypothetical protein